MYRTVVVGTDGTARARRAVEHARDLALATGATLHVVHAYRLPSRAALAAPDFAVVAAAGDGDAVEAAHALVAGAASELRDAGVSRVEEHWCALPAADALCGVAASVGADVIVVGNKGVSGARRVLGSVPSAVARGAPCAVLIVPTG